METDDPVVSLSLTHVNYNPNDHWSYLSAWLALVPQALCVVYATLIWSSREIEIILMFAGQMACEAFNFGLKRLIQEERPRQMYGKGYGMPSSHAQFVTFFSVSLSLFLLLRHVPHPSTTHTPISFPERLLLSLVSCLCAGAVAYSRIYLNYHTPRQVLVGVAAGAVCAVGWFTITSLLRRTGWIDWALDTRLAQAFRIRDLVVTEDLVDAGWGRWDAARKARRSTNGTASKKCK